MDLSDRLTALYTERADLLERIQRAKDDPKVAADIQAAATKPGAGAMTDLFRATMQAKVAVDALAVERAWTEQQILALLGNPALGWEENDHA